MAWIGCKLSTSISDWIGSGQPNWNYVQLNPSPQKGGGTSSELFLLKELHDFLEPFEVMTVIASSSSTVLSIVPLIKAKIQKLCSTDDKDDTLIRLVKKKVLKNLGKRLPELEYMKISQILDPETRTLVPQNEAIELLKKSVAKLKSA